VTTSFDRYLWRRARTKKFEVSKKCHHHQKMLGTRPTRLVNVPAEQNGTCEHLECGWTSFFRVVVYCNTSTGVFIRCLYKGLMASTAGSDNQQLAILDFLRCRAPCMLTFGILCSSGDCQKNSSAKEIKIIMTFCKTGDDTWFSVWTTSPCTVRPCSQSRNQNILY